jgi:hypothetical protein
MNRYLLGINPLEDHSILTVFTNAYSKTAATLMVITSVTVTTVLFAVAVIVLVIITVTFTLAYQLSGGSLLVSPDLNNTSR